MIGEKRWAFAPVGNAFTPACLASPHVGIPSVFSLKPVTCLSLTLTARDIHAN
jgi:hypothetical protein